ncbi:MAG: transcriptional activator RfaH [Rhodospirillales bacterium]|nr:transcriptional activator RfaH [Rhodospirillales bacterium]
MFQWYAVNTHPNAEFKADAHLSRQGFETYLPQFSKSRRHARKVETVVAPFFPQYLFVGVDIYKSCWRAIKSTYGVRQLVGQGETPLPVPSTIIEDLRAFENDKGLLNLDQKPRYQNGDSVEFVAGPLLAHAGVFCGLDSDQRIIVLLNLMGRQIKIKAPQEFVCASS